MNQQNIGSNASVKRGPLSQIRDVVGVSDVGRSEIHVYFATGDAGS